MECDFLVVGSGAAGLSAAVCAVHAGLRVIVAEKEPALGGTTAWSGGWMWTPRNPLARRAGINEDIAAPRAYLRAVLGAQYDAETVEAFLQQAPQMVAFFEAQTALQFEGGLAIPDTYGAAEGAGTGGRSVIAAPFDARALGAMAANLARPMPETTFHGMTIQAGPDLRAFMTMTRSARAFVHVARRVLRHGYDLLRYGRAMQLRNGMALVGRLVKSAEDLPVTFMLQTRAVSLIDAAAEQSGTGHFDTAQSASAQSGGPQSADQRIIGAVLERGGQNIRVLARCGVVLATGGFPHDPARQAARIPHSDHHLSVAAPCATGDGQRLAVQMGAALREDLAAPAAYCPVSEVPLGKGRRGRFPHIIERGKPGIIAVRANGARFCNEGLGYHDYVTALLAATPEGEAPVSWLICTRAFQRRYGLGIARPFPLSEKPWIKAGYIKTGATVRGLAQACGIDPAGLAETLERYNAGAERGEDVEFGRGTTPYMRLQGDPAHGPNPCVAPIAGGPFYAVKVYPGSFGTFEGLRVNRHAQVLRADGSVLRGLYAAGTDMASVMGGHYPAGGINLGPAMTFGYIAARHAAGEA
ncbi:FAD-dependent oxidoreductase [Litorivita sp. NS0012-18]|uniref:FAD-dependent oxidoreductase n=1 Tax=Litorivita sp. NS0012-18 TaxID=3127655 RepID=UPI003341187F